MKVQYPLIFNKPPFPYLKLIIQYETIVTSKVLPHFR